MSKMILFLLLLPLLIIIDPNSNKLYSSALKCYRSQTMLLQTPLATQEGMGEALECPNGQLACTILLDYTTGIVSRGCALDCSANPISVFTPHGTPFCMNTTSLPRQFCCCQTDLCNASPLSVGGNLPGATPQPPVGCDNVFYYTLWSPWAPPICANGIVQTRMRNRRCFGFNANQDPACRLRCNETMTEQEQHPCDG